MARCKACGREIVYIKMASGKTMPCNVPPVRYTGEAALQRRPDTLVTEDGRIDFGYVTEDGDREGYVSHFATCPEAGRFRRRTK